MKRQSKSSVSFTSGPYLVWMVLFILIPLFVVAYYAFTDSNGAFTFDNILSLSQSIPIIIKSVCLSIVAAVICLLLGYPVAYYMSRASEKTQRFLLMLVMLPMCMSFLLRTLAWVALLQDTGIINNFLEWTGIGRMRLIRNSGAVILGMVYNYLPFMILPLHSILSKMDRRLVEAAQDLGCNNTLVFARVTLPMSLPGIVSGLTMVFVPAVSTFYISNKLGGTDMVLIGDVIEKQFKSANNPNLGAAMSLLLMLIILISVGIMNKASGTNEEEW